MRTGNTNTDTIHERERETHTHRERDTHTHRHTQAYMCEARGLVERHKDKEREGERIERERSVSGRSVINIRSRNRPISIAVDSSGASPIQLLSFDILLPVGHFIPPLHCAVYSQHRAARLSGRTSHAPAVTLPPCEFGGHINNRESILSHLTFQRPWRIFWTLRTLTRYGGGLVHRAHGCAVVPGRCGCCWMDGYLSTGGRTCA